MADRPVSGARLPSCASGPAGRFEVTLLPSAAGGEPAVVERIATLINEVYAASEHGMWRAGTARTSPDEIAGLARAGQIAVARRAGRIVGCVRVRPYDADTGEFGMLAADPAHRGIGVGGELVRFAELTCRADGLRALRLEVLVPRHRTHPHKEFLVAWYTRMGYRLARTETVDEAHPELVPLLEAPADIAIYRKMLVR